MNLAYFIELGLTVGDYIWIVNEKGERIGGIYAGEYDSAYQTFKFKNYSNGQTEKIKIQKLQRIEKGE